MRSELPTGTVTFLFTDVEGSTRLLHSLGTEAYAEALAEHRRVIRDACASQDGVEVDNQGDAFFFAFPTAPGALQAASIFTEALASGQVQVRVGLHTGAPLLTEGGYVGGDVHRAARIAACGHGGQVLVSASTAPLVETELTDLGEHRLKDLSAPERIYQLGEGDFSALKSLYRTNLPVPATPFLGRERELADVVELLARDDGRLLTLTGPGGTGKTRLALQAAAEVSDRFPDGVWWIPLAPLREASLVLSSAAQVVGSQNGLAEHIADKQMLCLFDNFEQVVEAAPGLSELLGSCPNLDLLVTSRERLRVRGEQTYPVPQLAPSDGEALFAARARAVDPAFRESEAVSELCLRLDELPLAIELAAARTALFSPEQLLAKLSQRLDLLKGERDADPRQQTLRATIEWSYELLSDDEHGLFRRLAVFLGGCTYEAAEEIADADPDTLQSLLDKSLVRRRDSEHGPRFWMLETIREYAAEKLEAGDEERSTRDRHLDYFLALAERAYEERLRAESTWSPTVSAEHDNIRAALDWAESGRPDAEAQLASAVAPYWSLQGNEAYERLAEALSRYTVADRIRARALTWLGKVAPRAPEAHARLDEALELWREAGDPLGEALAYEAIGDVHHYAGEYPPARRAFEQSLALREQAGAPELEGSAALGGLCELLIASGEVERVEPMARELYELGSRYENRDIQGAGLHYLADRALLAGDYAEGERRYRRALAHARSSGFVIQCQRELAGVALSAAGQGDHARAVRLDAAANAQRAAMGDKPPDWWIRLSDRHIGDARAQLSPGDREAAERAGSEADFDAVLDEVLGAEAEPDA